jgi:hypothetical protein
LTSRAAHHCSRTQSPEKNSQNPGRPEGFWGSRNVWKRAGINTFRCLVGCTLGDFSALWFLQANYPDLGMGFIMGVSSKSNTFDNCHFIIQMGESR